MQAGYGSEHDDDVQHVGRLAIECKRRARGALAAGKAHVLAPERPGYIRVAATRDNGEPALATLLLTDLLKLERAALKGTTPAGGFVTELWAKPAPVPAGSCLNAQPDRACTAWEDAWKPGDADNS
jgi:hypothetical protein